MCWFKKVKKGENDVVLDLCHGVDHLVASTGKEKNPKQNSDSVMSKG